MHLALALFLQRILPGSTGKFYRNYTEQRFQKRYAVQRPRRLLNNEAQSAIEPYAM